MERSWRWDLPLYGAFVLGCLALDAAGKILALRYGLPLWLDSFGTALCAYAAGPACGGMVGLTCGLLFGMADHVSAVYGLTGAVVGIVVGIAARRRALDTLSGVMNVSAVVTLLATAVSLPLNVLFYGGSTGNAWGDGVRMSLRELGAPGLLCDAAGQAYVELLDKVLTLAALHLALRIWREARGTGSKAAASGKTGSKASGSDKSGKTGSGSAGSGQSGETPRPASKEGGASKTLLSLLMVAVLLSGATVRAADDGEIDYNDYVQTIYSTQNGLPCGEANDIAQTNDGVLWIGTYAGLYRYNGQEFRWMDGYSSVRNVNCLYVDEAGRLWIGTNDNGLSIAIHERIAETLDTSGGLPSDSVRSIVRSSDGYYYIGTTSSMRVLTLDSGLKRVTDLREIYYAKDSAADEDGHAAAVTADGRLFLLREGRILSSRQIPGGGEVFNCCCFAPDGRLLAGTTGHTIRIFDISREGLDEDGELSCEGLTSLKRIRRRDGGGYLVTADDGVGWLGADGVFHPINTNDFDTSIDDVLVDHQGGLWFTSSRLGLLRMAPSAFRDVYRTVGLESQVVNTVVQWQGAWWFGTDKGLDVVDLSCRERVPSELADRLSGVRIRCMTVDRSDHLWICTYGSGLIEIGPEGDEHHYDRSRGTFGNRSRLVTELSDGTILAGGDTGVSFLRDHQVIRTIGYSEGLINSMILTATELPDGRILVGTDGDGIAVLEDGDVARMLTRDDGLSSGVILRTVLDPKGEGVFLITSNGLCYLDLAGGEDRIRPLERFPYFNNYDLWARDPDTLFVMSSAGIYVVDRDELLYGDGELPYELLDHRQGLDSSLTANSWPWYDQETGRLFLACDDGVDVIDVEAYASVGGGGWRMAVPSMRLDNETARIEQGVPIVVGRSVSKIELFPEIIDYTIRDPDAGWWLEGFENDWTVLPRSSLTSITYTNLPPGDYTFHLAVFDDQRGVLSERRWQLVKEKELYDEPWFRFYLIGTPMLAVAWATWYIVHRRARRALELQERELDMARQQVQMGNETIFAIAKAVDAKDERTSQHSQRVSQYSVMIAEAMGMDPKDVDDLRKTAMMHDIGKIGIPDRILNKPARLTDEEYAIMKSHVDKGAEILKDFTLIGHVVEGARYHHERYDGKGYPSGLKGEEIPLFGRIIGVADAFDAMTANRVYRKQMDMEYVFGELRKGRGTQFDPQITDVFLGLIDDGRIDIDALYGVRRTEEASPGDAGAKDNGPGDAGAKSGGPVTGGDAGAGTKGNGPGDAGSKDGGPGDTGSKSGGPGDTKAKDDGPGDAGTGTRDSSPGDTGAKSGGPRDTKAKDDGPGDAGTGTKDSSPGDTGAKSGGPVTGGDAGTKDGPDAGGDAGTETGGAA